MFFPEARLQIWLYSQPCDMRKSYHGLSALVKNQLQEEPLSGQIFVFINRRRTQIKVLYFDRSGYCIWMKKLEQGLFRYALADGEKQALSWTELKLLLEGIELKNTKQNKRYRHPIQP
jgi:transposase